MQHVVHRVPVTALAFLGERCLLAGEGTYLKLYDVTTRKLLKRISLFEGQAIHGLIVPEDSNLILAWGGPLVRALSVSYHEDGEVDLGPGSECHSVGEWILHAAFAPTSSVISG